MRCRRRSNISGEWRGIRARIIERLAEGETLPISRMGLLALSNPGLESVTAISRLTLDSHR